MGCHGVPGGTVSASNCFPAGAAHARCCGLRMRMPAWGVAVAPGGMAPPSGHGGERPGPATSPTQPNPTQPFPTLHADMPAAINHFRVVAIYDTGNFTNTTLGSPKDASTAPYNTTVSEPASGCSHRSHTAAQPSPMCFALPCPRSPADWCRRSSLCGWLHPAPTALPNILGPHAPTHARRWCVRCHAGAS